jgi:hypothetical protein
MPADGVAIHRQPLLKSGWRTFRGLPPHPILFHIEVT